MKAELMERPWGSWKNLLDYGQVKVKELVIEPGQCLSDQRHFQRSEHWYIMAGELEITLEDEAGLRKVKLRPHDTHVVPKGTWHHACNVGMGFCHVLEVQYGMQCIEEDIERRNETPSN